MFDSNHDRDGRADLKWLSGLLLVVLLGAAAAGFSLAALAGNNRESPPPSFGELLLDGVPESGRSARPAGRWRPGEPYRLLDGVEVFADSGELPGLTPGAAGERLAAAFTDALRTGGSPAVLDLVADERLREQVGEALAEPVRELVRAQLAGGLLQAGLADGSRAADWRTQAAENPGSPVQPLVGVFVTLDPGLVDDLGPAGIGDHIMDSLTDAFMAEGEEAARALLANDTLLTLYDGTVSGGLDSGVHGMFRAVLTGFSGEIGRGLEEARRELSEAGGTRADEGAAEQFRRSGWLYALLALVPALVLIPVSRRAGRLFNPGLALLAAGLP
ncbi:MAG TPA: hypothetical protein VK092_09730, partial [Deinococcales bacterium]|nr:hypothetical protein [Deinococcales bacterium]